MRIIPALGLLGLLSAPAVAQVAAVPRDFAPSLVALRGYEDMSREAARIVAEAIRAKPDLVLGLATGSTPLGLYRELARLHREEGLDFSRVRVFHLDEYAGLPADHPQSYRRYLRDNLLKHVNVEGSRVHFLDGAAHDLEAEAARYESLIEREGGVDLQILGIGSNGHIGFNEPGSPFDSRTRVVELSHSTIRDNARFFDDPAQVPRRALSQGIGTILEARRVLLLADGSGKKPAVGAALNGPVTTALPASALRTRPGVTVLVDSAADPR